LGNETYKLWCAVSTPMTFMYLFLVLRPY